MQHKAFSIFILLALLPFSARADKLLTKTAEGIGAGLAAGYEMGENEITLTFAEGQDLEIITAGLKNNIEKISVTPGDKKLVLSGLPLNELLEKLTSLDIELDPLVALGGVNNCEAAAPDSPEAGGSIRASNAIELSSMYIADPASFKNPPLEECFTAKVVAVQRRDFPEAVVTLKVRQLMGKNDHVAEKQNYRAVVLLPGRGNKLALDKKAAQDNLSAFYLTAGDKVEAHVAKKDKKYIYIDYIKRLP